MVTNDHNVEVDVAVVGGGGSGLAAAAGFLTAAGELLDVAERL